MFPCPERFLAPQIRPERPAAAAAAAFRLLLGFHLIMFASWNRKRR